MANADIVEQLEQLRKLRIYQGEQGKVYGYDRAIANIKQLPYRLQSYTDALNVKGVGKSIATHIAEYLTTGQIAELATVKDQQDVLDLFQELYEVGPETAKRWYERGFRTFDDLPIHELTVNQRLSLQYINDLRQRIPRGEIAAFEAHLTYRLPSLPADWEIAGSYRRGVSSSGDVDIILKLHDKAPRGVIDDFIANLDIIGILGRGQKKIAAICRLVDNGPARRLDIEITNTIEYPACIVYFTGPKSFNVKLRQRAKDLGFELNEKFILTADGRGRLDIKIESDVFAALGVYYLTPEQRNYY